MDVDVKEFCGWPKLLAIVKGAPTERDRALVAAIFLTGGRISEVLQLMGGHFDLTNKDVIIVKSMPIVKRFNKVGVRVEGGRRRWVTEKVQDYRTFPIVRKEPLVPILLGWLAKAKKGQPLFAMSRVQAFLIIRGMGEDLYPHWFRAQRACQLAFEYGFDIHELMNFFGWKEARFALHYSHLGWKGLAKKMGVQV